MAHFHYPFIWWRAVRLSPFPSYYEYSSNKGLRTYPWSRVLNPLGPCQEGVQLGHNVNLFSAFWGFFTKISMMTRAVCNPTSSEWGFTFPHAPPEFSVSCFVVLYHSDWGKMIRQSFDSHFPNFFGVMRIILKSFGVVLVICILLRILLRCQASFVNGSLVFWAINLVICIFWVLIHWQLYSWKDCLPFCGFPFHLIACLFIYAEVLFCFVLFDLILCNPMWQLLASILGKMGFSSFPMLISCRICLCFLQFSVFLVSQLYLCTIWSKFLRVNRYGSNFILLCVNIQESERVPLWGQGRIERGIAGYRWPEDKMEPSVREGLTEIN